MFPSDNPNTHSDYYMYIGFFMIVIMSAFFSILMPQDMKSVLVILIPCISIFIPIFLFLFAKNKVISFYKNIDHYSLDDVNNIKLMDSPDIQLVNRLYIGMTFIFASFIYIILSNLKKDSYVLEKKYTSVIVTSIILFIMIEISNHFLFSWYKDVVLKYTDDKVKDNIVG